MLSYLNPVLLFLTPDEKEQCPYFCECFSMSEIKDILQLKTACSQLRFLRLVHQLSGRVVFFMKPRLLNVFCD